MQKPEPKPLLLFGEGNALSFKKGRAGAEKGKGLRLRGKGKRKCIDGAKRGGSEKKGGSGAQRQEEQYWRTSTERNPGLFKKSKKKAAFLE